MNELLLFKEKLQNYRYMDDDEKIATLSDMFELINSLVKKKCKEIKEDSKFFTLYAEAYISIAKKKKVAKKACQVIFTLGCQFFDMAYYRIAYDLFLIVKKNASSNIKLKCSFELAKLFEEAGSIKESLSELENIFNDITISQNEHAKAYIEYVKVQLNNLFFEESFKKNLEKLNDCESKVIKAIKIDSENYECYYVYGLIYEKRALYSDKDLNVLNDKALEFFSLAKGKVKKDKDKAKCCLALGKAYEKSAKITEKEYVENALKEYKEARYIYGTKKLNYPVFESIAQDLYIQLEDKSGKGTDFFGSTINKMMASTDMKKLEKKYYENKSKRKNFQREKHRLEPPHAPELHILRRWNSFTPILSTDTFPSKGGGYFITTGNRGIVFDPGFNFIQNFRQAGFSLNDIDDIFITHAHNDHTVDLESLLSLLHNYNEDIKGNRFSEKENSVYRKFMEKFPKDNIETLALKVDESFKNSPRKKRFNIYISPGAKEKCGFLKFGSRQNYEIIILNTKQVDLSQFTGGIKIDYDFDKEISIFPILAKHDDLMTDNKCLGCIVRFSPGDIIICYTGDTGYGEDLEKEYKKINEIYKRINNNGIILLAHIGGFKPEEQYYYRTDPTKALYKTHLGRLGLCKLIDCLKPDISLISEFGEEFEGCRKTLVNILQKYYKQPIFPMDIGFMMQIGYEAASKKANLKIRVSNDTELIDPSKVIYKEKRIGMEYEISYYKDDSLDAF